MIAGVTVAVTGIALVALAGGEVVRDPDAGRASASSWRLVFKDGFRHGLDHRKWGRYSGQPGGDPGGWWDPSHVVVKRGRLRLENYRDRRFRNRWVSGGLSSARALKQRYGKYQVRFRMDAGRGIAGVVLLWPSAGAWPPEIDFAENGGSTRTRRSMTATLHHGTDDHIVQRSLKGDFRRWHTMGVEWTPGRLVYTIDGRVWARVRSRYVPRRKMELDIQTQAGTCGDAYAPCPDASTPRRVTMEVDWVRAYAYRPAARR